MHAALALLSLAMTWLSVPSVAVAAPTLSVVGTCPGTMEISVTDVTSSHFALVWGRDVELETATGLWPCSSLTTGLEEVGGVKYFGTSMGAGWR